MGRPQTNSCLYGGTNFGCGTLFKITPSGTLTTLYNFCSQSGCADGQEPGALVQGNDGNLYGTTSAGGNSACSGNGGCGTLFKITTTGTLTTLHSFDLTDGGDPAGLIQATDGNFYGMTYSGGASNGNCTTGTCGTVLKVTPAGALTTLHIFGYTDGANPSAALIQASDGNFYGTTGGGRELHQLRRGLWDGLQNHGNWNADDAAQLRQGGWRRPNDAGPAHRWNLLRDDRSWGCKCLPCLRRLVWHDLQHICRYGPV